MKTDFLVIGEISMCENNFFTRLNEVMKEARGSRQPFSGFRLVVTGDVRAEEVLLYTFQADVVHSFANSPL